MHFQIPRLFENFYDRVNPGFALLDMGEIRRVFKDIVKGFCL